MRRRIAYAVVIGACALAAATMLLAAR